MNGTLNSINYLKTLVDKHKSNLVNIFFWLFIILFFTDRVINYFIHFPFFVISAVIVLPFVYLFAQYQNPEKKQLRVLIFSFLTIAILNSIIYVFSTKNISDFLFISMFFIFYFFYKNNINYLKLSNIYLFLFLCLFIFSFTFFSINSQFYGKAEYSKSYNWDNYSEKKTEQSPPKKSGKDLNKKTKRVLPKKQLNYHNEKIERIESGQIDKKKYIRWEPNDLDAVELLRIYHNGLFRLPHIASYFFGFLFLFFAYQYQKKRKTIDIILLTISVVFCIYTGTRVVLAAFILAFITYLFRKKYFIYLVLLFTAMLLMVIANEYFLKLTENTFLYQYFTFIKTSTENFTRLSRFRLWYSWWLEVKDFDFLNFIIGKSFVNALIANSKYLDFKVWYHNDFINIFYTYGVWGAMLYIWFFIKIYRDNKIMIMQNTYIFIFFSSMLLTAIINGFYYYFPVFQLYLFFLMIKNEKQLVSMNNIQIADDK